MAKAAPPIFEIRETPAGLTFRGALLATRTKLEDARVFLTLAIKKDPKFADAATYWMGQGPLRGAAV